MDSPRTRYFCTASAKTRIGMIATVAAALDSLAMRSQHTGDMASAERLLRESSRIWRMKGRNSPSLALTVGHLGTLLRMKGDDDGAEKALGPGESKGA